MSRTIAIRVVTHDRLATETRTSRSSLRCKVRSRSPIGMANDWSQPFSVSLCLCGYPLLDPNHPITSAKSDHDHSIGLGTKQTTKIARPM